MESPTKPFRWTGDSIEIIDQTLLPTELVLLDIRSTDAAVDAIKRLAIRGAPALGAFAALAVIVGLDEAAPADLDETRTALERLRERLGNARPTAVNLAWAVNRTVGKGIAFCNASRAAAGKAAANSAAAGRAAAGKAAASPATASIADVRAVMLAEAQAIAAEDAAACAEIGRLGRDLLGAATVIGTHCNAGRLATAGIGTALAPVYTKAAAGESIAVFAAETRPLLQGARLTAWELADAGIDVTVVPDGAMASLILAGDMHAFVVGADRIALNGDTANKIGTLAHALAAQAAGIPFYVAAPTSTLDPSLASGQEIAIEQRDQAEVHHVHGGDRLTPANVGAANPAFDVTPARLITAIITEAGVLTPPYEQAILAAVSHSASLYRPAAIGSAAAVGSLAAAGSPAAEVAQPTNTGQDS